MDKILKYQHTTTQCDTTCTTNYYSDVTTYRFYNKRHQLVQRASKKLFNSKITQLHVAKVFAVAGKKFHLAISGRKYDPGKKALKRKLTTDVKTADPQPSTSKDKSTSTQPTQAETVSEQQPEDAPIAEQQQESETGLTQQAQDDSTSTLQSQDESIPEQ